MKVQKEKSEKTRGKTTDTRGQQITIINRIQNSLLPYSQLEGEYWPLQTFGLTHLIYFQVIIPKSGGGQKETTFMQKFAL